MSSAASHPAQLCVTCMLTLSLHVCALVSPQVTLGKVLKVIVVMRSLFIDRTIVKGYNESVYTEDGKVSGRGLGEGFFLTLSQNGVPGE